MTAELIERLIRVLDMQLLPRKHTYLSGELGIIVQDLGSSGSYIVTVITKDYLHLTAERLQDLKWKLERGLFADMEVKLYVNEVTELRDRHLRIAEFQIFVGKKEENKK